MDINKVELYVLGVALLLITLNIMIFYWAFYKRAHLVVCKFAIFTLGSVVGFLAFGFGFYLKVVGSESALAFALTFSGSLLILGALLLVFMLAHMQVHTPNKSVKQTG